MWSVVAVGDHLVGILKAGTADRLGTVVAVVDSTAVDDCERRSGLIWKALLGRMSALIVVAGRAGCGALKKPPAGPNRCLGGPSSSG